MTIPTPLSHWISYIESIGLIQPNIEKQGTGEKEVYPKNVVVLGRIIIYLYNIIKLNLDKDSKYSQFCLHISQTYLSWLSYYFHQEVRNKGNNRIYPIAW